MKNLLSIICILLVLLLTHSAFALTVSFHKQAVVDGDDVTLAAVASISPQGQQARSLARLSLASSPSPGEILRMQSRDLWARLCRLEPSLTGSRHTGAEVITIRRAGVPFSPQKIKRILDKFLQSQQERFPDLQLNFVNLQLPRSFVLPKGQLHTEIRPSSPDLLHSRSFNILFRIEDRPVKNISVRGQIEALAEIPVLVRDLPRGTMLEVSDLHLVRRDVVPLRQPYLDIKSVVGKKAKRNLRQGQPVSRTMVVSPPVVKRGEVVMISLRHGSLAISAKGVARKNGGTGETISVRNINSQRDILCKVIGPGQVKVGF